MENTTDTWSILVDGDSEVTILSPVGAPGVSDDQELFLAFFAVSNSGDSVVNVMTALLGVQDTMLVHLEGVLVGFDTDANWLNGKSSLHLGNRVLLELLPASGLDQTGVRFSMALSILALTGGVWVVCLGIDGILLGVFEGKLFKTTIAALVSFFL